MSADFGDDDNVADLGALFHGAGDHFGAAEEPRLLDAMQGDEPGGYDHAAAWGTDDPPTVMLYGTPQPEFTDETTDLSTLHEPPAGDTGTDSVERDGPQPAAVSNPAGTVWVSAGIGGNTLWVHLSAAVMSMTEADLAEEICVLADLARLKGQAGHRTQLVEAGSRAVAYIDLPTSERAAAAQAKVFASRYASDD